MHNRRPTLAQTSLVRMTRVYRSNNFKYSYSSYIYTVLERRCPFGTRIVSNQKTAETFSNRKSEHLFTISTMVELDLASELASKGRIDVLDKRPSSAH